MPTLVRPKWSTFSVGAWLVGIALLVGAFAVLHEANLVRSHGTGDDRIVAVLGANIDGSNQATPYPEDLRLAARQVRDHPDDKSTALDAARLYIRHGRALGDSRLVSAALAALLPWQVSGADAEMLDLIATAKQYQHDFAGALDLLDQAIALRPDAGNPRLTRANILVVQGQFSKAHRDCVQLSRLGRLDIALICDTTVKSLTSDAPGAYRRLEAVSRVDNAIDPKLNAYVEGLLGEVAMFRGWTEEARKHFDIARSLSPEDLRLAMVYADLLLQSGESNEAVRVMAKAPATDGILLRRAIAYKAANDETHSVPIRLELDRRFLQQQQLGVDEHAREAARFHLAITGDVGAALERARTNWRFQREFEDAQLLLDAAAAAHTPREAIPVLTWIAEQKVDAPALRIPPSLQSP